MHRYESPKDCDTHPHVIVPTHNQIWKVPLLSKECSNAFIVSLGFLPKNTREKTDIGGKVPPIIIASSCTLDFLPTFLSYTHLLRSGPMISRLVYVGGVNMDDTCRIIVEDSLDQEVIRKL